MLSITTDCITEEGSPEPYLKLFAEAGFSHVHWCHEWGSDYLYADEDVKQIAGWMKEFGLELNDLHASEGREQYWLSTDESARSAGVELVKNRLRMAARLGSDVIVLHLRSEPEEEQARAVFWTQLSKSLDELEPYARDHWVRIAVENLLDDNYTTIEKVLGKYSPEFIGVCYDSGHGLYCEGGLEFLGRVKERLISLHLNDNDGTGDQHLLPFAGKVDWKRLTQLIAESSYDKGVSLESTIHNTGFKDEQSFLRQAHMKANIVARMIENARPGGH